MRIKLITEARHFGQYQRDYKCLINDRQGCSNVENAEPSMHLEIPDVRSYTGSVVHKKWFLFQLCSQELRALPKLQVKAWFTILK